MAFPFVRLSADTCTEAGHSCGTVRDDGAYYLWHDNQTATGMSGGPYWWRHPTWGNAAASIHQGADPNRGWKVSTEITKNAFNNISAWKND